VLIKNQPLLMTPAFAAWNTVARFDDYETAQRAVDRLSDDGFPVETLDIVGSDLRLVERVTGRLGGLAIGAVWGAVFGFAAHAATRGQRDFSSVRALSATRYDVIARDGTAERARTMLGSAGLLPADSPHAGV
jgi:hypothetical protein